MRQTLPSDKLNQAPDTAPVALLLIDVINDLEFEGGADLLLHALPMANALATFKRRAKSHRIPVIYVNDNFGRWRSDFAKLVAHCLEPDVRGGPIVKLLRPDEDDYFILKPKHSAFFQTNLEILLGYLGVTTLVLAGIAGDICVLFSANDAYMRDFALYVPEDCVAANTPEETSYALSQMHKVLKADIRDSAEIDLANITGIETARRRQPRRSAGC